MQTGVKLENEKTYQSIRSGVWRAVKPLWIGDDRMEQVGKVVGIQKNMAEVQIRRTTACGGDCGKCGGCFPTQMVVSAKNTAQAKEGQKVMLDLSSKNILSAAFMVYIVPIILLIGSFAATQAIVKRNQYPINNELAGIIAGGIVLIIFFVLMRFIDKKMSERKKFEMEIRRIIE